MDFMKIRNFAVMQKFRFDLGISFLTIVNFTLLVITASSTFQKLPFFRDVPAIWFVVVLVPSAMFGVWLFGFILDKFIKYYHQMRVVSNTKDPFMMEILERIKNIEAKIDGKKVR